MPEETYRYAYQGQFSEQDLETGWNHFELREYDPVIGRWLVPDPMGQYWSPYMAMGNNPVNSVDPDGGKDGDPPLTGKPGDVTTIGGKGYMWDGKHWSQIGQETTVTAPPPSLGDFFDMTDFNVAPMDATKYVVNFPGGVLSKRAGYGLYIYSSGGGPGGRGSYTPGTDPMAEGFDLSFLLENYDGRSEDQHGLIEDDQKDNKMDFTRYDTLISTRPQLVYKLRSDGSLRRTYIHDIHKLDKRTGDTLQTRKNVEVD